MKKCIASILAMCILLVFVFSGCAKPAEQPAAFVAPENYVTVVQVTINPTVNLYLDASDVILAVEYVNADAKECYEKVETQLVGSKLENAVQVVVDTAATDGYFAENNKVTIDIVEAKQEDKKLSVITTAADTVKSVITEKQIQAEVALADNAQKVVDDKVAADKAEADRIAAEKAAAEKAAAEKAAAEKAAAEKAAAEKAAAEKAAAEKAAAEKAAAEKAAAEKAAQEKELKNPQKNLKKDTEYSNIKPGETDETLTGIHMRFKDNGEYAYSKVPYLNDPYGEGEYITYNGKKYYVSGGGGGGGTYSLTDEKITLTGAFEMVLTMTTDGKLVIETMNESDDFFKVGDILSQG